MNICNKTDVGANNADMSSTTLAPNSVMKNKNSNMEQHKNPDRNPEKKHKEMDFTTKENQSHSRV